MDAELEGKSSVQSDEEWMRFVYVWNTLYGKEYVDTAGCSRRVIDMLIK